MYYVLAYYIIGVLVSVYYINYYRYSDNKSEPKPSDGFGALVGPWIFPLQILKHLTRKK